MNNIIIDTLFLIVILSFIIERGLALFLEHPVINERTKGYKEFIALGFTGFICWFYQFDAISILMKDDITNAGLFITACVIAGGSKASLKLFRDVLGVKK